MNSLFLIAITSVPLLSLAAQGQTQYRKISLEDYRDKMKAGWIGQIAGVSLGGPTEFKSNDRIIPESEMPKWQPDLINRAFNQDDVYVEMTFLRTMELHGLDCSIRQAGIDFANTSYPLWCANREGRINLRKGIAPPDSSHPRFNGSATIIDYQIESDYSGLIAPGMPNVAIAMGDKFGRLVNYGDGVYAGQFIGAMYAAAFFEKDIRKVVELGLQAIPADSQYAAFVRDMLQWSKEIPEWEKTWELLNEKYYKNPEYVKKYGGNSQVDARINGAYVLMGLLYGKGDPDQTMIIATRCGKDSDCNPSTAAGVLFTTLGFKNLPERFTRNLDEKQIFTSTVYNVPTLIDVCEQLARKAVVKEGGRIVKDANGAEVFQIPARAAKPGPLESSFAPGPIANSTYTPEEMARITAPVPSPALKKAFAAFAPEWSLTYCNTATNLGLIAEERGRSNVFATLPFDNCTPCVLSRNVDIRPGKKTVLKLAVADHVQNGEWLLEVQVDGRKIYRQFIGKDVEADLARKIITPAKAEQDRKLPGKAPGADGWTELEIDLSEYAGNRILLGLGNGPTDGYHNETAYWSKIAVEEVGEADLSERVSPGATTNETLKQDVEKFAPGWALSYCGDFSKPGLRDTVLSRRNVLVTHPFDRDTACVLAKKLTVPAGKKTTLGFSAGHDPAGDWLLEVQVNRKVLVSKVVTKDTTTDGWMNVVVDLTPYAGQSVFVELLNQPNGWSYETGYWANLIVETKDR
ncbi:MAG: ADP-ribosylglycohydrolase family protein [Luteolibacter sp.]|jgi:hypothetical protein|nr:ADP-ribosylglycohydrolase family protein [Luteolibacter sp.]